MSCKQTSSFIGLFLIALITVRCCRTAPVEIVGEVIQEINTDGYDLMYTLSNGVTRSEVGLLTTAPDGRLILTVKGAWSQPFEADLHYDVEFSADENGFRPRLILQRNKTERKVKG